jgi:outer membrane protein TolC
VADKNSRLASLGFENGAGSLISVIDAQRQAQRARLASIEAQALMRADMAALFVATAADWRKN